MSTSESRAPDHHSIILLDHVLDHECEHAEMGSGTSGECFAPLLLHAQRDFSSSTPFPHDYPPQVVVVEDDVDFGHDAIIATGIELQNRCEEMDPE